MTTKLQNFSVEYFLTRALFLGIGFSLITGYAKQDSIFAFFIGTIIGIIFIYLINKIQEYKKDKTLNELLTEMGILGIFLRILLIIYGITLFLEGLTFFGLFATSFLTTTPIFFITLPITLLVLKITKDNTTLFKVAACLLPISLTLTLLSQFSLFSYSSISNIMPLFITKPCTLIKSIFYYTSLSVSPSILMLITTTNNKNSIPAYLLSSFTLIFKMYLIIAIVGPILASLYRFPEYVILKEIKILDFIEKIENIVALSWILDHFIYISTSALFIKELLPKKTKKIIHPLIIISIYFISFTYFGKIYTNELIMYYTIPYFIFIIFIIVVPILLIYTHKHKIKK
jgi:spore germination protein KB